MLFPAFDNDMEVLCIPTLHQFPLFFSPRQLYLYSYPEHPSIPPPVPHMTHRLDNDIIKASMGRLYDFVDAIYSLIGCAPMSMHGF